MRRLLATTLAALALAAPAQAQDAGAPVVGGGSFNSAPILEPGRYHDTILPSERLYYGFRLAPGQSLRVSATAGLSAQTMKRLGIAYLSGSILAPTRDADLSWNGAAGDDPNVFFGGGAEPEGPLVVTSWQATGDPDAATDGTWHGPGVYFFDLYALYGTTSSAPPKAEIPFTFDAEVLGTAQPGTTPTATSTPATATPTPRATATPAPETGDDGGPPAAAMAVAGVGGILIGVIAAIARRRRR